ncbi:MAG TPA: glycosyltransferase family 4 protein [Candidatus Limnocylindrales bacterium]|jgi:glycosyltransferase involved in cell wall biosynthesis|nr:glycosyltransferase family 4 protein [Candidatus Limnocylindrales bacterium]
MIAPLRIAQVAPPLERVPPAAYGGTERVVFELVRELVRRGHDVTTFASGDSEVPGVLEPTVARALRPDGYGDDPSGYFLSTMLKVEGRQADFDLVHSHLEWYSAALRRSISGPFVATFHGRLDHPWSRDLFADRPDGFVAISKSQASVHPDVPWTIVYNGLSLDDAPFERRRSDELLFVGRVAPEKGIVEAIEIAQKAGRRLTIAAKLGPTPPEQEFNAEVFEPALKRAGSSVEFLGELSGPERDGLFAHCHAVLMPGSWPEPFGLVAIEALACGAPILARNVGALGEIIRDGVDGFFGDDAAELAFLVDRVDELDRAAIRTSVIDRFSARRMADGYEALYARMLAMEDELASPSASESEPGSGSSAARAADVPDSKPEDRRDSEHAAASTGSRERRDLDLRRRGEASRR